MTYSSRYAAAHYRHRDLIAEAAQNQLAVEACRKPAGNDGPGGRRPRTARRAWGGLAALVAAVALLAVAAGALA